MMGGEVRMKARERRRARAWGSAGFYGGVKVAKLLRNVCDA